MRVIGSIIKGVISISVLVILALAAVWVIKHNELSVPEPTGNVSPETALLVSYEDTSPVVSPTSSPTPGPKDFVTPTIIVVDAIVKDVPKYTPTPKPENEKPPFIKIIKEYQITNAILDKGGTCTEDYYSYVSWSPDGEYILTSRSNGKYISQGDLTLGATDMWKYSLSTGKWNLFTPNSGTGLWSPDGRSILYSSLESIEGLSVFVIDSNGKNVKKIGNADWQYPISWFGTDAVLFFSNDIDNWDVKSVSGKAISAEVIDAIGKVKNISSPVQKILPASSSQQFAYIQSGQLIVENYSGKSELLTDQVSDDQNIMSWTSDDQSLAYVEFEKGAYLYDISIYNTDTGTNKQIFKSEKRIDHLSWFPDNQTLLFQTHEGNGVVDIQVISENEDDDNINLFMANPGGPQLSPDGNMIAFFRNCNLWLAEISIINKKAYQQ